jgi:hypothetical protein
MFAVPFTKAAKMPPVDPFQALAITVTPASTARLVYWGITSTWAALAPELV